MGDCFKFVWPFHNVQTLKTSSQQISYELRSIEIVPSDKGHHDTPLYLQKLGCSLQTDQHGCRSAELCN